MSAAAGGARFGGGGSAQGSQVPRSSAAGSSPRSAVSANASSSKHQTRGRGIRSSSMADSVGWNSLADLSELELDGELDSDMSGEFVKCVQGGGGFCLN